MLKLIPGFGDLMSNRGQEKVESINVRDEIDEEAAKPLEDYGAQIRSDTRANGAEFANYLRTSNSLRRSEGLSGV